MTYIPKFGMWSSVNCLEMLELSLKGYKALTVLHYFADDHGRIFQTQSVMAEKTGLKQSHLSVGIRELIKKSFVSRIRNGYVIDPILIRYNGKQ